MRFLVIFVGLIGVTGARASENDWQGLDYKGGYLGVRYGAYDDSSTNYSMNATLPLPKFNQLHFIYSQFDAEYDGDAQSTKQWGAYWNTDPLVKFSFGVGYEFNGEGSEIENQDYHLYLQYASSKNWSFRAKALYGDIDVFLEGFAPEFERQFQSLELFAHERKGLGLSINYDELAWGFRLSWNYYDYQNIVTPTEEDAQSFIRLLSEQPLEDARLWMRLLYTRLFQGYRDLGFTSRQSKEFVNIVFESNQEDIRRWADDWITRRTVQRKNEARVYYRVAYGQQSLLSIRDMSLDLYWVHDNLTWSTGVLTYQSYIEEEYATQVYGSVDYHFSHHYSFGALFSRSDDGSGIYGELSLGFDW